MSEKENIKSEGIAEVDTNELAPNATTHSENTAKLSDFQSKILKLAFQLGNFEYSEAHLLNIVGI